MKYNKQGSSTQSRVFISYRAQKVTGGAHLHEASQKKKRMQGPCQNIRAVWELSLTVSLLTAMKCLFYTQFQKQMLKPLVREMQVFFFIKATKKFTYMYYYNTLYISKGPLKTCGTSMQCLWYHCLHKSHSAIWSFSSGNRQKQWISISWVHYTLALLQSLATGKWVCSLLNSSASAVWLTCVYT